MKVWYFYNARLGTMHALTDEQMLEYKKFYHIDIPLWDEYHEKNDYDSLRNARGDMFLWKKEKSITLELKRYNECEYSLGGVVKITDDTEYGEGHFATFIFDRRVWCNEYFEYVRCRETGEYFVKDGKWVAKSELKIEREDEE